MTKRRWGRGGIEEGELAVEVGLEEHEEALVGV